MKSYFRESTYDFENLKFQIDINLNLKGIENNKLSDTKALDNQILLCSLEHYFSQTTILDIKEGLRYILSGHPNFNGLTQIEQGVEKITYRFHLQPIHDEDSKITDFTLSFTTIAKNLHNPIDFIEKKLFFENIESEKRKISRELHDDLGQRLTLIKYALMSENIDREEIIEMVHESIDSMRSISHELSTDYVKKVNIVQLISELINRLNMNQMGIQFSYSIEDVENKISNHQKLNIFRIVQECVSNILKHSLANKCELKLQLLNDQIFLTIENNGISFDYEENAKTSQGLGLKTIQHRVEIIQGNLITKSTHTKHGVRNSIVISFPVAA